MDLYSMLAASSLPQCRMAYRPGDEAIALRLAHTWNVLTQAMRGARRMWRRGERGAG